MADLTNLSPAASYGSLLTLNSTGGLTSTLQQVQDGFGNGSALQLATSSANPGVSANNLVVTGSFSINSVPFNPAAGIQTVTGTLNSAQIQNLFTSAVEIPGLTAPGVGKMYVINAFTIELVFGTAAYTGGGNLYLEYGNTAGGIYTSAPLAAVAIDSAVVTSAVNQIGSASGQVGQGPATVGLAASLCNNMPISITNDTAVFATGLGTINYYIQYSIVSIT